MEDDEAAASDEAEDEEHSGHRPSALINSKEKWRKEMAKWVQDERALDTDIEDSQDGPTSMAHILQNRQPRRSGTKWLPRSLDLLFAGRKDVDIDVQIQRIRKQTAYTEEARLMELLAAEEADEETIPDDGELEGSGDDFHV